MQDLISLIESYIDKCEETIKLKDVKKAKDLQDLIISTFNECIPGIRTELDNYSLRHFHDSSPVDYIGDINKIKCKLEIFLAKEIEVLSTDKKNVNSAVNINNITSNTNNNTNNNTNTIQLDVEILFKETMQKIENDETLGQEEMNEILDKINEIKSIYESNEPKNKKWFKLRPTMEWLATKGVNIATAILGLLAAIFKSS